MIVRICRGQPELAVRVVAPGCDGGQLVDYEDMELCILAPKCTCEGPFSKIYFHGCGWWGHDMDRWNEQQVPPEQMPVLVYPAFDVNDNGEIVFKFDSKLWERAGRYVGLIRFKDGTEITRLDLDICTTGFIADKVTVKSYSCHKEAS